jgi:hypothetical protein
LFNFEVKLQISEVELMNFEVRLQNFDLKLQNFEVRLQNFEVKEMNFEVKLLKFKNKLRNPTFSSRILFIIKITNSQKFLIKKAYFSQITETPPRKHRRTCTSEYK